MGSGVWQQPQSSSQLRCADGSSSACLESQRKKEPHGEVPSPLGSPAVSSAACPEDGHHGRGVQPLSPPSPINELYLFKFNEPLSLQ